jgi:hypothetical protein
MRREWKTASLGAVVRYSKEFIEISDLEKYKRRRVQISFAADDSSKKLREVREVLDKAKTFHGVVASHLDSLLPSLLDRAFKGLL